MAGVLGVASSAYIAAIALLRRKSASLWQYGLPNNYLDSAGVTAATVDNPVGLDLDAMGVLGAELVGAFSGNTYPAGFFADSGWAISGGVATFTYPGTGGRALYNANLLTAGKTYRVQMLGAVRNGLRLNIGGSVIDSESAIVTTTSPVVQITGAFVPSGLASVTGISIREITGIHASQATTANKPVLRRGVVNLLTYSQDFTNAAWILEGGVTRSGSTLLCPADGNRVYAAGTFPSGPQTFAVLLSGSGTCTLFGYNGTDSGGGNFGIAQITLTATPTIYVTNYSPTAPSNWRFGRLAGDTATSITFGAGGLFAGTYTADQILAAGGIPLTTSAPASSTQGPYWLDTAAGAHTLGATISAGYESSIVIDAVTNVGATVLAGQNLTGAYSVYGGISATELVTNGGPFVNTAGWASVHSAGVSTIANELVATNTTVNYPGANWSFATTVGATYILDGAVRSNGVGASSGVYLGVLDSSGNGTAQWAVSDGGTAKTKGSIKFIATGTTSYIGFGNFAANAGSGSIAYLVSVSVREVLPGTSGRIILPGTLAAPATLTASEQALLVGYTNRLAGL